MNFETLTEDDSAMLAAHNISTLKDPALVRPILDLLWFVHRYGDTNEFYHVSEFMVEAAREAAESDPAYAPLDYSWQPFNVKDVPPAKPGQGAKL